MSRLGSGMQAKFVLAMSGAMLVVVVIVAVVLGRQATMQGEVQPLSGNVIPDRFHRVQKRAVLSVVFSQPVSITVMNQAQDHPISGKPHLWHGRFVAKHPFPPHPAWVDK